MSVEDDLKRLGATSEANVAPPGALTGNIERHIARRIARRRARRLAAGIAAGAVAIGGVTFGLATRGQTTHVVTVAEPTTTSTSVAPDTSALVPIVTSTIDSPISFSIGTNPALPTEPDEDTSAPVVANTIGGLSPGGSPATKPASGSTRSTVPPATGDPSSCTIAAITAATGVASDGLSELVCESGWASTHRASPLSVLFFHSVDGTWNLAYTVTLYGATNTTAACPPAGIPADMLVGLIPPHCQPSSTTTVTSPASTTQQLTTSPPSSGGATSTSTTKPASSTTSPPTTT